MSSTYQELNIFQPLLYRHRRYLLKCSFGPITIMNTVMTALENLAEKLIEFIKRIFAGSIFLLIAQCSKSGRCHAEEARFCVPMQDPSFYRLDGQQLMPVTKELIEQCFDLIERKNVFILYQFSGRHPPTPTTIRLAYYRDHGNFEIIESIRKINCFLKVFGA